MVESQLQSPTFDAFGMFLSPNQVIGQCKCVAELSDSFPFGWGGFMRIFTVMHAPMTSPLAKYPLHMLFAIYISLLAH